MREEPAMDDVMLDAQLSRAAAAQVYPRTPALRARLVAEISREAPPESAATRSRLAMTLAGAAIVAAGAVVLAVPGSRSAVADFFGIEGSRIERLPTAAPGTTATPFPPASALPANARQATLDEAEEALGFAPALPERHDPSVVYIATYGAENVAILRYERFDLWEGSPRARITFGKGLPEGVVWLELTVNGRPAYWIEGGDHIVAVFDEDGDEIPGSERTAARNTLIFSTERAFYRMETGLSRLEALAIAETLP